ncbi:MAG: sn-glycerol-3-phosphate ABC transporter ATP-binding protein UgpC [Burkholderiales bacterium]|nr:sn-glycerol-3-phosphate ABC transporter ATP-binding protein UgpC [Burkholderiales bacterium]
MASVTLSQVVKRYGTTEVVHGVDIAIDDGEFCVLVGPSGCGKSTLLRMVAGLEEISGGTVSIGDRAVNDLPPKERDVAMVFQSYALYPHMTVRENMGFSLMLAKRPKSDIDERVNQAAEILGLTPYLDRLPKQLSGGQRQRVAMGRAIVRKPQVFLFDEPLSNLDAKLRVQMRTEIKALHQRLKVTSIYVTHDQIEAMTMADKIVVLKDGRVEQIGAPLALYDRPCNLFVAGFIGSPAMNFLKGTLNGDGTATVGSARLPAPGHRGTDDVTYGIRPEHLSLGTAGEGLKAVVDVVEPTGADTMIVAHVDGDHRHEVQIVLRDRVTAKSGDTVWLNPDAERVHLFDAASGARLG